MSEQSSSKPSVDEKAVIDYLRQHPNFFEQHPQLLADISLPHESGEAVSLVERQVAILRERNMDMRHRLSKLLDNARENDKLFEKTRRLVLMLLEGNNAGDLVNTLLFSFERDFEIPYTAMILFGDADRLPDTAARVAPIQDARQSVGRLISNSRAICGDLPAEELQFLFPQDANEIGSAAAVPLMQGTCFGILAVGNSDPDYYRSSMGTLFLTHIGEVLNRLLPKHLTA